MKRRSFLKGLFAACVGTIAVPSIVKKPVKISSSDPWNTWIKEMQLTWSQVYVKLLGDNGEEIFGKGYARAKIKSEDWDVQNGKVKNNKIISFPKAKQDWGNISGYIIADSKDNSLIICKFHFTDRRSVSKNCVVGFLPGEICVEFS